MLEKLAGHKRLVPTLLAISIALFASWMGNEAGGYFTSDWALVVLIVAGITLVASLAGLVNITQSAWCIVAVGFFSLYAAWTFLSILWSPNQGDAWLGAGQTLLYLLVFWIVVGLITLQTSRRYVLAAAALGPAVVGASTLLSLANRTDAMFVDGRLQGSVGYYNGEAAFLLVSFWTSMYLAGSRLVHPLLRSLVLAGAVLCVELAVLTQSRGAAVALIVSSPVFFVLSGQRLRGLIALLPAAAALIMTFSDLNNVYAEVADGGVPAEAVTMAVPSIVATVVGAAVYGLVWGLVDGLWTPPTAVVRAAGTIALVGTAVVLVTGAVVSYERVGSPIEWGAQKWEAFTTNDRTGQEQSRYLSASGNGRYVYWQVAWRDFTSSPWAGIGTQNYEATYYQDRAKAAGYVRQPHNLPLEVLAERGVVGGLLFFGFLSTCIVASLSKRFGHLNAEGKAQVGAMTAAVAYWFVHSCADWFWQLPAVTLPVVVYLAMLVAPWETPPPEPVGLSPRLVAAAIAAAALLAVTPLYVSDRYLETSRSASNPWNALLAAERAQRFNPVDPNAAQREGELALKIGDWPRAEEAFLKAAQLNPQHYAPRQILGLLYEREGRREKALSEYRRARELNPLDSNLARNVKQLEEESSGGDPSERAQGQ